MRNNETQIDFRTTLNCNGICIALDTPKVMGIVNINNDSFYVNSRFNTKTAIEKIEQFLAEGATFIDLGAVSSKPGAQPVSEEEERERLLPVLKSLIKRFPETVFSIDTFRPNVARAAIELGAGMINDITGGGADGAMFKTIANAPVPIIIMHMQGTPATMQHDPQYRQVTLEIYDWLTAKANQALKAGVKDIVIDPGFGFGKTQAHNYALLKSLSNFKLMGLPVLVGVSRKSMIWKVLASNPEDALYGTISAQTLALLNGANIIRTHDVKAAIDCIKIIEMYESV